MKKILCKFYWDCGRQGYLEGIFVTTPEERWKIIGETVYFGEVLGKHSEVYGTIDEKDIGILNDDQDFIEKAEQFGMTDIGYNPFEYWGEEEE